MAEAEGPTRADIVRAALAAYEARGSLRVFTLDGVSEGDGTSIADALDAELLKGFGA